MQLAFDFVEDFAHPRANRELRLGQARVAYEFKRGKRRTIGFSVGPDGLSVRAPQWVTLTQVDEAVREKTQWILDKLSQARERRELLASNRIVWRDGTQLSYLGQPVVVVLDPLHSFGDAGAQLDGTLRDAMQGDTPVPMRLRVSLAHHAKPEQIRDAVQAWLMRQCVSLFKQRLDHFAPLLGVRWRKLSLSNAGTRWGTAKSDGSIRLNWRLIHFKPAVIDYVVAHELSHLRVMDHSPRFWDTVASVVPDYAALRSQLKDDGLPR